jgi:hypothetical protein
MTTPPAPGIFSRRLAAVRATNAVPSISGINWSLCREMAPSANSTSGRSPFTSTSMAVLMAWRSTPSRYTLKAPMRRSMKLFKRLCLNRCHDAIACMLRSM